MTTCMENSCSPAAGDVFVSVLFYPFSHEMSWMRSGTDLSQFLKIFLPILSYTVNFPNLRAEVNLEWIDHNDCLHDSFVVYPYNCRTNSVEQ